MRKRILISSFCLALPFCCFSQSIIRACNECHGLKGISPSPKYPNLAGQHKSYFIKQLQDMKNHRLHCPPKMASQLAMLTDKDLDEIAGHYAQLPVLKRSPKLISDGLGKKIYTMGDYTKGILACIVCHGPEGGGNAQAAFPVLAGQSTHYIIEELHAFKRGKRTNDINQVMQSTCKNMSFDEIKAVAKYIERF